MKKILIVLFILMTAISAFAGDNKSVGNTATAAITAGTGYLKGIIVSTDSANAVTLAVYDNATAATGSKLFSTLTITTSAANRATTISFDGQECPYVNGIYAVITCAGSVWYDVYFENR